MSELRAEISAKDRNAVHLDELDLRFPVEGMSDVAAIVENFFGAAEDRERRMHFRYDRCLEWASDCFISYNADFQSIPEAILRISGGALLRIDFDQHYKLFDALSSLSWDFAGEIKLVEPTHFDIAFDDFTYRDRIRVEDILEKYAKPRKFGPYRVRKWHGGGSEEKGDGCTIDFGKRGKYGSGEQFSIYDKNAESGGHLDCVRYEWRGYSEKAKNAWEFLRGSTREDFEPRMAQIIGGAIDFFDTMEANQDRRKRAPWWQSIVDELGSWEVPGVRVDPPDLGRTRDWVMNSCASSIWLCMEEVRIREGDDAARAWLSGLLTAGERRCRKEMRLLLPKREAVAVSVADLELPF